MAKLVHVEMTAADVDGTAGFYAAALGIKANPSPFLPGYTTLDGESGPIAAIMSTQYQTQRVIAWFGVDDIEATLAAIEAAGGERAGAVNTIPGQGLVAYATDSNGVLFGLQQAL